MDEFDLKKLCEPGMCPWKRLASLAVYADWLEERGQDGWGWRLPYFGAEGRELPDSSTALCWLARLVDSVLRSMKMAWHLEAAGERHSLLLRGLRIVDQLSIDLAKCAACNTPEGGLQELVRDWRGAVASLQDDARRAVEMAVR